MKKTNTAEIFCDECGLNIIMEFEMTSDLFDMECPNCSNQHIWFGEIDASDDKEIIIGRGGCSQK